MRKYMSRSKQIIYLCNLTMSVQVIKFLCEMFSDCNVVVVGEQASEPRLDCGGRADGIMKPGVNIV